ncbi:MAG: pantoate--beta-alanine ligase [Candidatus Omnitrophica bacterium]|nr:pantoate--beta-alanine ligase [Candidatus Omnitrophota bacterium]
MQIFNSIIPLKKKIKYFTQNELSIGFVPTMGALHEGHASLLRRSRRENDISILSIYVNPSQFDHKKEDFSSYPRDKKKDILLAKKENVDIIFLPSNKIIYPKGFCSYIVNEGLTQTLCGRSRPGHFRGVTTIVGKLLNIIQPNTVYLGQKDAQQAIVLTQMVKDLNYPCKVKICPTVREKDGLAMSSRNIYLSPSERKEASILYQSLKESAGLIKAGERKAQAITSFIRTNIQKNTSAVIDYVECVHTDNLQPIKQIKGKILIALAVKFSKARLIDNIMINTR